MTARLGPDVWGAAGLVLTPLCVCRMYSVGRALEELLVAAQRQEALTLGVYESAKLMNV